MEAVLISYGLPGIVILALGLAVLKLWGHNVELQKLIYDIQEARLKDAKEITKETAEALAENTRSAHALTDAIKVAVSGGRA